MSGIAALLQTNGEPLQHRQVQQMASCISFRGPDGTETWLEGPVGLTHAAFHTTRESARRRQPLSLDDRVWLTAYARLDDQAPLRRRLKDAGQSWQEPVTDGELILRAYQAWSRSCTHYLTGDFTFIIWDTVEQRLFCARDQLGVRPLYYALHENLLIVGNTLSCVRSSSAGQHALNEIALADYLQLGHYVDLAMTAYQGIQRLPPAHSLTWQNGKLTIERYWSIPDEPPLHYKRSAAYVDHFRELFSAAVSDRLRTGRVAITLSGGMDSTAVAAVAVRQQHLSPSRIQFHGFTNVYGALLADDEERFARRVAEHLGITLHVRDVGSYHLFQRWDNLDLQTAEPADRTLAAWSFDHEMDAATHARVTLSGLGGDPLFFPEPGYLYALLKPARVGELLRALSLSWQGRRLPPLYLRTTLRQRFRQQSGAATPITLPKWINQDLITQGDLLTRWRRAALANLRRHPRRPILASQLSSPFWPSFLESFDSEHSYVPHETRHPFFDLRLIRFMLRVPPVPWCVDKHLLRAAVRPYLPDEVVRRPKQPLSSFPYHPIDPHDGGRAIQRLRDMAPLVRRFGDLNLALDILREPHRWSTADYTASLRLIGLANWLDGNQK